jgi:hypothetical protein
MGLDRTIRFPNGQAPAWAAIREQLARVGESGVLRMIDGLPAFPDEEPPPEWHELRVGTATGMVTIRRTAGVITCVVWGNADAALSASWAKILWACAAAGDGLIEDDTATLTAAEYAHEKAISPE